MEQEGAGHGAEAAGADDDQVGVARLGDPRDLPRRITLEQLVFGFETEAMSFGAGRGLTDDTTQGRRPRMADATIKRLDEMESFYDGLVLRARASLGVTSWGMQVFNLPPEFGDYPNHHHGEGQGDPGQEEVYIPLEGWATLHLDGERHRLEPGTWARVGITQLRQIVPGADGFRYIAIGGTPGIAFAPPAWTELGAAPPSMPE